MAGVTVKNVTIAYGDKPIVRDVSFAVQDGECFAVLGPSACGKTTLARGICGFNKLNSGEIYIGDKLVVSKSQKVFIDPEKRDLGVVFQDYAVWPHMTVFENVRYPLKKRGVPKDEAKKRAMQAIDLVRMSPYADRLPSQLSGGQQQRVALARALVSSEKLLILDEPITNLDANLREEMRFEIKELQRKIAVTVIYITHDQGDAMAIADRIAIMDTDGRIRQIGDPETVYKSPQDSFVYKFIGLSNFLPIELQDNHLFVVDGEKKIPFPVKRPEYISKPQFWAASHPSELQIVKNGEGLPGTVNHVIFLGNTYEYRIQVGSYEVRVIQDSAEAMKTGIPVIGESCGINFDIVKFYEDVQEGRV